MRTSFSKLSLLALPLAALTACQDYDPLGEEGMIALQNNKALAAKINEYTQNFESRYGKIDPSHDWGMFMTSNMEVETRAAETRRNMWIDQFHLIVPGWPDTYYIEGDPEEHTNGYHNLDSGGSNANYSSTEPHGNLPAGDVTDEEIQYVSWWFRTHKYPESVKLHWTDFYVQGISADNDRNDDGTIINTLEHYEPRDGVWQVTSTDDDKDYSIDEFATELLQKDLPTSDPGGWDHINNFNRSNSNLLNVVADLPMKGEDWSTTLDSEYKNKTSADITNRLMMLYYSSGTENFRAHYSTDNTDLDWNVEYTNDGQVIPNSGHSSWVLVHLTFTGKSGRLYDGYYLAFDYQCFKEEDHDMQTGALTKYVLHKADGYYSNWIFKLSPALASEEPKYASLSRRIMCEDLGNTFDFDFNDVVFDATYNITQEEYDKYLNGQMTTSPIDVTIRLQAAGGTLPIFVGVPSGGSTDLEAHHLLGNHRSDTPVNVNAPNGGESAVAIYHYQLVFPQNLSSREERLQALSLNNIPIYVQSADNKGTYLTNSGSYWGNEYSDASHPTPENKGSLSAPRAFGVPVGVCWMNECQFIETSYTRFDDWVRDQATWGDDSASPWYMTDVQNTSNIYSYVAYEKPASGGNNGPDYSEYGTKVETTIKTVGNQTKYFIPINTFVSGKKYEMTIIVESNNKDEYPGAKLYPYTDNGISYTQYNGTCSKVDIDPDAKIYGSKSIVDFTSTSVPTADCYTIEELNSIKSFKEIRVKDITE